MKHLTKEQYAKLKEVAEQFARYVTWGNDVVINEGEEFEQVLQEELIEPFIEPLINGEI